MSHRLIGLLLPVEPTAPDLQALNDWSGRDKPAPASDLLWAHGVNVDRFLFLARLPVLLSGVILSAREDCGAGCGWPGRTLWLPTT